MQGTEVMQALQDMLEDDSFHTEPGYSIDAETYPNNSVPFVDSHMNYLSRHPQTDPSHYLSNLRLMLKVR